MYVCMCMSVSNLTNIEWWLTCWETFSVCCALHYTPIPIQSIPFYVCVCCFHINFIIL